MIRLLAIDIDGTLLDSRGRLPDVHRDAVVDAVTRGVSVALVTGRSFHFARPVAELLPVPLTLIVNNGAVVKTKTGGTLLRHALRRETAREILERTPGYESDVALVFDYDHEANSQDADDGARRQVVYEQMDWSAPNRKGYFEKNKAFIAPSGGPLVDALTADPIQVMFNGGVDAMRMLAVRLRALPCHDEISVALTEYPKRDFSLVDVNRAGCSKGSTLAHWTASRGWTAADVMAVGDNLNDVDMLDFAGTAYVMDNAEAAIKTRGYLATASNDEGGLAIAIARELI
jgi:Cof subfamily protein (haloacid dehalogenase superfamily)